MNRSDLWQLIRERQSYLCVGLDTDPAKIPASLRHEKDPLLAFNKAIIEATADYAVAYKPNLAFYEALGAAGWETLRQTLRYLPERSFKIADAKRGDIGNTAAMYAKAFFEEMGFDAVTLSPYMGQDSIAPFLAYPDKWAIVLALTSNAGSADFQQLPSGGKPFWQHVVEKSQQWGTPDQVMFVVGATRGAAIGEVRQVAPDSFFLVPGVGAQGGDLAEVSRYGLNSHCGLLVNSSRAILYASTGEDFAQAAAQAAQTVQADMAEILKARYKM